MRRLIILVTLILLIVPLFALRNWDLYTNTTHIYDVVDDDEHIYVATWGGLNVYDKSSGAFVKTLTVNDGMAENHLISLLYDEQTDYLMIGSFASGIERWDGLTFKTPLTEITGLQSLTIRDMIRYEEYIMVATDYGLSIFIEEEILPIPILLYNITHDTGLISNTVSSLAVKNDYLYCGTDEGLSYVHLDSLNLQTAWASIDESNSPLLNSEITSLSVHEDNLAIATKKGVLVTTSMDMSDPDTWRLFNEDNTILDAYYSSEGKLWLSYGEWNEATLNVVADPKTNYSISLIYPNEIQIEWLPGELGLSYAPVKGFTEIDSELVAYTWGDGFQYFDGTDTYQWINKVKENCIASNFVSNMKIDHNGILWVGDGIRGGISSRGRGGMSRYDGTNWITRFRPTSPLSTYAIYDIGVDTLNRKWFVSWHGSVASILDDNQSNWQWDSIDFGTPPVTEENMNWSAFARSGPEETIWISIYPFYVNILSHGFEILHSFHLYDSTLPGVDYESDIIDIHFVENKVFFGTRYHGILLWDDIDSYPFYGGFGWVDMPNTAPISASEVFDITSRETDYGTEIWFATSEGLLMYGYNRMFGEEKWHIYGTNIKKKVWHEGAWFYSEDHPIPEFYYVVGQERLFASVPTYPTTLFVDPFGQIWVGSHGNGFTIYNPEEDTFTTYNKENSPLLANHVTSFEYDEYSGILYIGTVEGLNSVEIGIDPQMNIVNRLHDVVAFPNPFYPEKGEVVRFENRNAQTMPAGDSICTIYDLNGDLVITMEKDVYQEFSWDGRNAAGRKSGSGLYFYVISTPEGEIARGKIALIR